MMIQQLIENINVEKYKHKFIKVVVVNKKAYISLIDLLIGHED